MFYLGIISDNKLMCTLLLPFLCRSEREIWLGRNSSKRHDLLLLTFSNYFSMFSNFGARRAKAPNSQTDERRQEIAIFAALIVTSGINFGDTSETGVGHGDTDKE